MRPLLLSIVLGLAVPAAAHLVAVDYTPEQPEVGDVLAVTVSGYLPDSCWQLVGTSQEVAGQQLRVFVDLLDAWTPDLACLTVITEYEEVFLFAGLAAGSYTLVVTERHDSLRDPEDEVVTMPVEITGSVDDESRSWSALRASYR
jgi:hypothetical protein